MRLRFEAETLQLMKEIKKQGKKYVDTTCRLIKQKQPHPTLSSKTRCQSHTASCMVQGMNKKVNVIVFSLYHIFFLFLSPCELSSAKICWSYVVHLNVFFRLVEQPVLCPCSFVLFVSFVCHFHLFNTPSYVHVCSSRSEGVV